MPPSLHVSIERWPLAEAFTISRGSKTEAEVVVAEITDGQWRGRGECVPYPRYGESPAGVAALIASLSTAVANGLDRAGLQAALPAGAARNALDCALWDLEAKRSGRPVHAIAQLPPPRPAITAYTISLGAPEAMAQAAARVAHRRLLKVKLGAPGDAERIAAVRKAAPAADLIVDANEGWTADNLTDNLAACAAAGVKLVEQPLPAGHDDALRSIARPLSICADESVHTRDSLAALAGKYDAINIKLDKAGGLTEALTLLVEAERLGLSVMVGCMVSTSLAVAPALLLAGHAQFVDLDGPLLLARDRPDGLRYHDSVVQPSTRALWG
ncbi:MAG TPA: N-acetyl-D-Glu racemase DgcA [Xanthobacteraceae bacterium]|nr:N-acetyl-D-Glu racemase DgcA [Xanthobacteraceae bacterium]